MKVLYSAIRVSPMAACLLWVGCSEPVATDPEPDEAESTESAEKRESRKTAKAPPKVDEPVDRKDKEEALRIEAEAQAAREAAEYAAKRKSEVAKFAGIRAGVVGRKFQSVTLSERTFEDATILEINDREIRLSHSAGVANLAWEQVEQKVKDLWGFDPGAAADFEKQQQLAAAEQESLLNSPDHIESRKEAERAVKKQRSADLKQRRSEIDQRISQLNNERARGEAAISKLKASLLALQRTYKKQDSNASRIRNSRTNQARSSQSVGGISTSKADRKRQLDLLNNQIAGAELALKRIDREIKVEYNKLRDMPRS